MPDFNIVISFFHKKPKQARVTTFVCLFRDDATIAKGPGCDEGTNLPLRDLSVVLLMPTREFRAYQSFVCNLLSTPRCECQVPAKGDLKSLLLWKIYQRYADPNPCSLCLLCKDILRTECFTVRNVK